ncbi:MAG TPA: YciI family protein [Candidatus Methylomirabilis sp.]|nr:YciI family protein [Candidatus Methylomirabilis sp.]
MQFLLLIYETEANWLNTTTAQKEGVYQEYGQLIGELTAAGKFNGGSQLNLVSTASTVRVRNGKRVVTDGPFAETKEQLGGYMLVDAADLDDAIAIAGRVPTARNGSIEVRPLMVHPERVKAAKG